MMQLYKKKEKLKIFAVFSRIGCLELIMSGSAVLPVYSSNIPENGW